MSKEKANNAETHPKKSPFQPLKVVKVSDSIPPKKSK